MRLTRFALLASSLAFVACQPAAETPEQAAARMQADTDSARAAITPMAASFATHISAGHTDSLLAFYSDNAVVMAPNMPAAQGHAAIRELFAGMMAGGPITMHITTQNVSASGDMAVERGRYHFTGTMGGMAVADSGKYLAHWHRSNGSWKMVEDIWNSDAPAMPAPRR